MAKILIIANFCNDENCSGRFTYLAKNLSSKGHSVEVVTSDFNHPLKMPKNLSKNDYPFKMTYMHEPGYPDNISLKRLYSHYIWGRNVRSYLNQSNNDWDIIYCAVPSLTATRLAGSYARKHNIKFITDVQDLWPEAFELAIRNKRISKLIFAPFHFYANLGYKKANKVVGVSDTYRERGLKPCKKETDGLTVYLGNDGATFDMAKEEFKIERTDNEFWIAYIGTLGYSYDLKCVIDAIAAIDEKTLSKRLHFMVMGDGPKRKEFERYVQEKGIAATFTGSLPYPKMVGRLCSCDVVANPIVKGAAQSITNKVGDYALAGLPIINTQECKEYRDLIDLYNCGINCEVGNSKQVADAIVKLANDHELCKQLGENSRRLGTERFDRRQSYKQIINFIEK